MSRDPERALSPEDRWVAMQRLAAGDSPARVGVIVGAEVEVIERLIAHEPGFADVIEDERSRLSEDATSCRERLKVMLWQALERAIIQNRISTINFALRQTSLLDAASVGGGSRVPGLEHLPPELRGKAEFLESLDDEQLDEYLALSRPQPPTLAQNTPPERSPADERAVDRAPKEPEGPEPEPSPAPTREPCSPTPQPTRRQRAREPLPSHLSRLDPRALYRDR